jgi:hypothetical protein
MPTIQEEAQDLEGDKVLVQKNQEWQVSWLFSITTSSTINS